MLDIIPQRFRSLPRRDGRIVHVVFHDAHRHDVKELPQSAGISHYTIAIGASLPIPGGIRWTMIVHQLIQLCLTFHSLYEVFQDCIDDIVRLAHLWGQRFGEQF